MILIPAIDLKDGKCVRLRQGVMEDQTVFSDDPLKVAQRWVEAGARRLHMVDLNGAFAGRPVNGDAVTAIARRFPELPIQIGGGIRSLDTIEHYVSAGVSYVIIGTQAVKDPDFVARACAAFPGHVMVGLDAKDGMVAINGWAEVTDIQVIDLETHFRSIRVMFLWVSLAALIFMALDGPLFGAHYFGWYGEGAGSAHWNDDACSGGVTDMPALGYYPSSHGATCR